MRSWMAIVILTAAVAGCAYPPGQSGKSDSELLEAGTARRERLTPPAPLYCYRTLADVDCQAQPATGESSRLVGAYPPAE